jgi:hypothetical protein
LGGLRKIESNSLMNQKLEPSLEELALLRIPRSVGSWGITRGLAKGRLGGTQSCHKLEVKGEK